MGKHIASVRELIDALGGDEAVADLLNVGVHWVRECAENDWVPVKHRRRLAHALPGEFDMPECLGRER